MLDDYYEVKFFSDYVGIDYDNLLEDNAIYLGHAYVRKESTLRTAKLLTVEKDEEGNAIDYKTTRQAPQEGKHAEYKGWTGKKADGDPIDLDDITESCSVFARFEWLDNYYNVKVLSQGISLFEGKLIHGSTIADATEDPATPFDCRTLAYMDAPYYKDYALLGYDVIVGDVTTALDFDQTEAYSIVSDVKFEARWDEGTKKTYTVCFNDGVDLDTIVHEEQVVYDEGVTYVAPGYSSGGKTYIFNRFTGVYGEGPMKDKPVDPKHIRYDCVLTPIFEEELLTVTFMYKTTVKAEYNVSYGEAVEIPSVTSDDPDNKVITGDWVDEFGDPVDLTSITESITVYAVEVDKKKTVNGTKLGEDYSLDFEYDAEFKGYGLHDFESTGPIALEEADWGVFDPTYPIVSILDFDGDNGSEYQYLTALALPSTVKAIYADAMMALKITALDLTNCTSLTDVQFHAFRRCLLLETISLPGSLANVGSKICDGNTSLTAINLAMSEATKESRNFDPAWNDGFESITNYAP